MEQNHPEKSNRCKKCGWFIQIGNNCPPPNHRYGICEMFHILRKAGAICKEISDAKAEARKLKKGAAHV
ncbi:MAG: hypothetical protein PHQ23_06475 [Candidatus Wallbacteria bacterium]|nr:hypothetical protein [Candidatus Wallbacteria bacterium]